MTSEAGNLLIWGQRILSTHDIAKKYEKSLASLRFLRTAPLDFPALETLSG